MLWIAFGKYPVKIPATQDVLKCSKINSRSSEFRYLTLSATVEEIVFH
jgi:hypothetical protein